MKTTLVFIFLFLFFKFNSYSQAVGIGTAFPSDALHVVSAANDDPLRVQVGTATKLRVLNNGGTTIGNNNTSGTPANGLYVDGNTGLGVSNPADKLSVNGNINITGEILNNGTSGEAGQQLVSNGNGTMVWADPCGYTNYEDFFNPDFNPQTWTVPLGVTEIMVEMWGAGGGGSINFGGGGGAYMKIKKVVTPGQVLTFNIGEGGLGINSGIAATAGGATTFPSNHSAGGGSAGNTGLGGNATIINADAISQIRKRGQFGKPRTIEYYPISATEYAQKTIYGDGGVSGYGDVISGHGGVVIQNTTSNSNILSTNGRPGNQPGGGGGGGEGSTTTPFNNAGSGGDGYLIIYW